MPGVRIVRTVLFTFALATAFLTVGSDASAQLGSGGGMGGMGGGGAPGPSGPAPKRYVPPKFAPAGPRINVAEVRLKGDFSISESRIRSKLQTREGRQFDPAAVQADVRQLLSSGLCYDVRTYREDSPNGVIITYELFEQPLVQYIRFVGNKVREKTLLKKAELDIGQPLSNYRVDEAKRKLIEFYQARGNSHVNIVVREGNSENDKGVVFEINEGPRQRYRWTKFEGNSSIASDSRLRTRIDSKPGILWYFKGQVDTDVIDEDVEKLTSYYRSLGFFKASITKELTFNDSEEWATLTFYIDEGPRYVIRSVTVEGNEVYGQEALLAETELVPGDYFDLTKMNNDVRTLRDAYGANGYIKADVQATPQFDLEPGQLDLVYRINEGNQHRVRNIIVNMGGEYPHTRHSVVLNRMGGIREGDIIDSRELRDSERRLGASQLFDTGPLGKPEIAVQPVEPGTRTATRPTRNY